VEIAVTRAALRGAAGLLLSAMIAGCATPPADPAARAAFVQSNDPLEPMNRRILEVNLVIDRILLKPAAKLYLAVLPAEGRDAVRRALDNMKEPVVVINDVLQGEFRRGGISLGRFAVNSTLGIAGLAEVAAPLGLPKQTGDFGQTLYTWGFPEGPYLVVPVLGPSNPRDLLGMAGDNYLDPFSYVASAENVDDLNIDRFIIDGIDQRARVVDVLDDLQKHSIDFYAELRSLSQQRRAAELRRGMPMQPGSSLYDDPAKFPPPPPAKPGIPQPQSGAKKPPPHQSGVLRGRASRGTSG
jgi:phospholipid-binding lipoprotein MlaA